MYLYLYDASLADQRFANELADIEARITDVGLQGRVGRLGPLKSAAELVRSGLKAGVKTVVAVGNDRTVAEVINATAGTDATVGVIPIGKPAAVARLLGIPEEGAAVPVLAARKIETVDLGKINGYYFLTSAEVRGEEQVTLSCDERYTIRPHQQARVTITNLNTGARCQDGFLEAVIESIPRGWWGRWLKPAKSLVPLRRGTLSAATGVMAVAENFYTVRLPATIEIVPQTLKIIVGRNRVF